MFKRYPFSVTLHLDGRHPYLEDRSFDHPSRDVVVVVQARSWRHAEREAVANVPRDKPFWSFSVKAIARGDAVAALLRS